MKLSWIPLFHARGRRTPSLWVTGATRFESVDIICQIWPIRGYTRSWYTGTGRLKKWLQAPPPLLSPVSLRFIFVFVLSQFSGPNYLGAWNRLHCGQSKPAGDRLPAWSPPFKKVDMVLPIIRLKTSLTPIGRIPRFLSSGISVQEG